MNTRHEINTAWIEGLKAGKNGDSRAANPYIGNSEKAKAWDEGWSEGSGYWELRRGKDSFHRIADIS